MHRKVQPYLSKCFVFGITLLNRMQLVSDNPSTIFLSMTWQKLVLWIFCFGFLMLFLHNTSLTNCKAPDSTVLLLFPKEKQ